MNETPTEGESSTSCAADGSVSWRTRYTLRMPSRRGGSTGGEATAICSWHRAPRQPRYLGRNVPRQNVLRCTDMTGSRPSRLVLGIIAIVLTLATGPAVAGSRVVVGGVFGVPGYPYPYPYPYYPYPYPAYPYYGPYSVPPPGWVAGHWEWRQNPSGQSVRVWIPPYLQ
jgi:hypothetical protein